jgi:hypothetical protein
MRKALLRLENIKRFCDQLLISDILLFPLPGNGRGILRNHLWAMDDVNDKFVHPFFSSNFFVSPRSREGSSRNRTAHHEQLQHSHKTACFRLRKRLSYVFEYSNPLLKSQSILSADCSHDPPTPQIVTIKSKFICTKMHNFFIFPKIH